MVHNIGAQGKLNYLKGTIYCCEARIVMIAQFNVSTKWKKEEIVSPIAVIIKNCISKQHELKKLSQSSPIQQGAHQEQIIIKSQCGRILQFRTMYKQMKPKQYQIATVLQMPQFQLYVWTIGDDKFIEMVSTFKQEVMWVGFLNKYLRDIPPQQFIDLENINKSYQNQLQVHSDETSKSFRQVFEPSF